ncbi:very short patch repair endonuclease [Candidatus Margulisiibacteriota bacterium]
MTDIVSSKKRSKMMSNIRSKNTKPELILRRSLFEKGFRYKLHSSNIPGKPDMVFLKHKAVILVNGCFWHGHGCHIFKWPKTRKAFWKNKINGNKTRDRKNRNLLKKLGWRVLVVWECAIKSRKESDISRVVNRAAKWLNSKSKSAEIVLRKQGVVL